MFTPTEDQRRREVRLTGLKSPKKLAKEQETTSSPSLRGEPVWLKTHLSISSKIFRTGMVSRLTGLFILLYSLHIS
jgi:hypothetical protein